MKRTVWLGVLLVVALSALVIQVARGSGTAAGAYHSVVVGNDGVVRAWGYNYYGQLGDGSTANRNAPVTIASLSGVTAVAAGANHTLALKSDGTVWTWGYNGYGQLGNNSTTNRNTPGQVSGLSNIVAIAAGDLHSLALEANGTVWAWGDNAYGKLGDGTTTRRLVPTAVPNFSATVIGAGAGASYAMKSDLTVWAWGQNTFGQLGDGSTTYRTSPVQVSGLSDIVMIRGGYAHTLAVKSDGTVYGWGYNVSGQIGDGTTTQRLTPVLVSTISGVQAIGTGPNHSLAVDSNGNVWTWGYNGFGQLGDGTKTTHHAPGLLSFTPLGSSGAGGQYHSVVTMTDGSVWAWGANSYGQVGDGTTTERLTPVQVIAPSAVATPEFSVGTGTYAAEQTVTVTCATPDATIHYTTTGVDPTEQDPTVASGGTVPVTVSLTLKAKAWKTGEPESNVASATYTLAVAGPVLTPGPGTYGSAQTVSATTSTPDAILRYTLDGTVPTETSALYTSPLLIATTTTVTVKGFRSGWTDSPPAATTYGFNYGTLDPPSLDPGTGSYISGQLATLSAAAGAIVRYTLDGSDPTSGSTIYTAPIALTSSLTLKARAFHPDWTTSAASTATYVIQVAAPEISPGAGSYAAGTLVTITSPTPGATLRYTTSGLDPTTGDPAIASGGTLVLGNYTLKVRAWQAGAEPSAVTAATYAVTGSLTTVAAVGGASHSLALESDGTSWAWGANGNGQLGDTTTIERRVPVGVYALTGVTALAGGGIHSVAGTSDGAVWTWGGNGSGQLGDGTTTQRLAPVVVTGLGPVTAVTAGSYHTVVVQSDGTAWAWGRNLLGELGDGTTTQRTTPVQVGGLTGVVAVSSRDRHTLALRTDGTVWAWGSNGNGQLGDGTTQSRTSPVQVSGLTDVTAIAAGTAHSLAVKADGTVWAWGYNLYGRLGDGTMTQRLTPVQVSGLTGAVKVAAGSSHSLALRGDGTVWAWGYNGLGQLGDGTTTQRLTPVAVGPLANIVALGAGDAHSLAVSNDGVVWTWGKNANGQLGDGTTTTRLSPVVIANAGMVWKVPAPVLSLGSGTYLIDQQVTVSCADPGATLHYTLTGVAPTESDASLAPGGVVPITESATLTVGAWKAGAVPSELVAATYELKAQTPTLSLPSGRYGSAQSVTIATATAGATLTVTQDGTEPTSASTAYGAPVSVTETGTLKARAFKTGWTASDSAAASYWFDPGPVDTPTVSPAGGPFESAPLLTLACTTAGATIRYTLDGSDPALSSTAYEYPFLVPTSATLKVRAFRADLAASAVATETYVLDAAGQTAPPLIVPGGGRFSTARMLAISGPAQATLRYTTSGADPVETDALVPPEGTLAVDHAAVVKVRAWADGLSPSAVRRADVVVTGALAAGHQHSLGLAADGTVWAWGRGTEGQLGDGTGLNRDAPVSVLANATAVAGGRYYSLAVDASGGVWGWGDNLNGQLGDESTTRRFAPVAAHGLSGVVAVAAGWDHSLALKADGTVWAWGHNDDGQLGDGTTQDHSLAVQVVGLAGVTGIAAGEGFSLAVERNGAAGGRVWAWGRNTAGQLGDGSTLNRSVPVRVLGLDDAAEVAAGQTFGVARLADGTVRAWGANDQGQLGDLTGEPSSVPVVVPVPAAAVWITAGVAHGLAGDAEGRVWGWGLNASAQLGTLPYLPTAASGAPQLVPGATAAYGGAAGWQHTLVLRADGGSWASGTGTATGLGSGTHDHVEAIPGLSLVGNAWLMDDADADGLPSWLEWLAGTDPFTGDTNGNGLGDLADVRRRSQSANPDDDGDGLPNATELLLGTDPFRADTDGDGVSDLLDFFPLDPTRTALPAPDPYDTTPPTITLIYPTNARLVGGGD